jgi:hypothetical protein
MTTRRFWVDTETTGLDSRKHSAFQIAYRIEENGKILFQRSLKTRPDNYEEFAFTAAGGLPLRFPPLNPPFVAVVAVKICRKFGLPWRLRLPAESRF